MTSFTECWWFLSKKVKSTPQIEQMRMAEMQLVDTIDELKGKEETLKKELKEIAMKVKTAQAAKASTKVKQLVTSSVAKRGNLGLTTRKRMALEQQLDAIATTQLNQQVLSSMKQTSTALKSMGLENTLNNVDEVMTDMQEATTDIGEITQTLSGSLTIDSMDDEAMQAELALLMGDEVDGIAEPPAVVNSIRPVPVPKKEVKKEEVVDDGGVESAKEEPMAA
tara:strand:- start:9844 stop:10512 length:669 start_codon:yes stop_codon:yes gene_type:complete